MSKMYLFGYKGSKKQKSQLWLESVLNLQRQHVLVEDVSVIDILAEFTCDGKSQTYSGIVGPDRFNRIESHSVVVNGDGRLLSTELRMMRAAQQM